MTEITTANADAVQARTEQVINALRDLTEANHQDSAHYYTRLHALMCLASIYERPLAGMLDPHALAMECDRVIVGGGIRPR